MTENTYIPKIPATNVGLALALTMIFAMESGADKISIREDLVEQGTFSEFNRTYTEALIELNKAKKELAEILAIEYQSLLDSQCEIDPEIDAIISESLSDLYMTD